MRTIHVALAATVLNGRLLVARRRADAHLGGSWELPGGKVEPDESPADAARREAREECGIDVDPIEPLPPVAHDYADRRVVLHAFICRLVAGQPRALECDECRWVDAAELKALPLPDANGPLLPAIIARLRDAPRVDIPWVDAPRDAGPRDACPPDDRPRGDRP